MTLASWDSEPQITPEILERYDRYFDNRSFEEIFEEDILPSTQDDHEHLAFINHSPQTIEKDVELILNSNISDKVWSQEAVRQFRKKSLQVILSFVLHYDQLGEKDRIFSRIDKALKFERAKKTDTEW